MRSQIRSFLSITALVAASNSIAQNDLLPLEEAEAYSGITESRLIFRENCAVCHGENLDGRGPITILDSARGDGSKALNKGAMPVDLTSDRVTSLSDGEVFGYITWGGRPGLAAAARGKDSSAIMPQFGRLLTEQERWELVWYMRQEIGAK